MQTHSPSRPATDPASAPRTASLGKKALAVFASVALCAGLMPMVPAWGAETDTAADVPAAEAAPTTDEAATPAAQAETTDTAAQADSTAAPAAASASEDSATDATSNDAATDATATESTPDDSATSTDGQDTASDTATTDDDPGIDLNDPSITPGETVNQYFPTDEKATAKLLKKLTARFVKGGSDSKMDSTLVNAAIALNSLDKGLKIDTDAIIKKLVKDEKKSDDGLTLGQYGRYIMMLTDGGIDCTAVSIGGKTRNLVTEMEKLLADTDPTIEEAVYLLPVYGNDGYEPAKATTVEALIGQILLAQDEDGYFWASETEDTYSVPLTAQAILALFPYMDDEDMAEALGEGTVSDAISLASEALYDAQLIDGSWPADGLALDGDVPATAYATTALVAIGSNPAVDLVTSNQSTPLGYLTAHADEALDGYADLDKDADPVTSAAVLMALAAAEGIEETKEPYDVYDVRAVDRPAETSTTTTSTKTPTSSYRSTSGTKTIPQSGDETPLAVGSLVLIALAGGAAVLRARRKMSEA
ncbi:hypothetical protein [uncultured Adlercreutzia sp.]|uniref:hypothetical protein n=1 Tax=uncultured Adlercreutzia sp. TaxID=875803 RepID=UPI0025E14D56|nr:hypothetical protein [uncultured Adlercreutzia sp.]MCI9262698.1 hypothetical protein [Eggerthellaceae bacterium]